jgi:N4-(beta-N-acetylglucosaminyl)-L-asparaginase
MLNRREWMMSTAAFAGASGSGMAQSGGSKQVVISSANGLRACKKAMEMLQSGADTLDAVVAGVNIVEEDPEDTSVGYGGLPNEDGVVELDSCVMHGPSRRCGSVGAIHTVKTPSKIAQLVMEKTDHIMLVSEGADRFARAWGYKDVDLLTEKARLAWLVWKMSLRDASGHNNWGEGLDAPPKKKIAELKRQFPDASEDLLAWAWEKAVHPPTGTINCMALNSKGEMSGVTTTSGLAWKIPGRVGDSPIIGAGLYVDQDVGGGGSTGRGEENIRVAGGHTIVENMRHGMSPRDACLDALKRVARNFNNDKEQLAKFDLNFYALRKDGEYGAATLWKGKQRAVSFAVNDGGESRLEPCAFLMER